MLTLNCVCANDEEQRPDFTDLVRLLRGLRDLPDTDDLPSSPTKKQSGKPQVFQRPLFWFMHVVWVEDRPTFPETIIEWRAAEKGFPIKVRNMTFGRTEYESALQSILSDQLMKCISRKAFEIEVTTGTSEAPAGQSAWGERIPCTFHIRNLGKNGMGVGHPSSCAILQSNDALPLKDGDHISLCYCEDPSQENVRWVPFLIFRFRLTDPEDSSCAVLKDTRNGAAYDAGKHKRGYVELPVAVP